VRRRAGHARLPRVLVGALQVHFHLVLAMVGPVLTLIGQPLSPVGDLLALVGDLLPIVRNLVP
jgi:hypothetical protein